MPSFFSSAMMNGPGRAMKRSPFDAARSMKAPMSRSGRVSPVTSIVPSGSSWKSHGM